MRIFFRAIIFLIATTACSWAELVDSLHAVVNDTPITQQQVELFIGREEQSMFQQLRGQPELFKRQDTKLREDGSEALISREVILNDFKESIKVPDSIIDEIVSERLKDAYPDHIALTKQLQMQGITLEQKKKQIRDQFVVEQMIYKFVPEPIISPLKIETYYNEHHSEFKMEDQIKMRMISLNRGTPETEASNRKRAEEILAQVKSGASFEDLAKTYSEGSLRSEGGETGWEDFSVVNTTLAPELNKLKPGEHSGVIETPEGFYIVLLEDRHPAHFKPLNDVRAQIEKVLSGQETQRLQKQWVERLKRKTFIKYF